MIAIGQLNKINDPLSEKFRYYAPEEFMTTPVHVLCSNFTEIPPWKVGETMRYFGNKKIENAIFRQHFARGGRRKFAGKRAT